MTRVSLIFGGALALAALPVAAQQVKSAPVSSKTVTAPRFEVDMLWPQPMPNRWILGSVTGVAAPPRPSAAAPTPPDTAYTGASNRGAAPGRGAAAGRGGRGGRGRGGAPALPPNSISMESFGGVANIAFDPTSNEAFVADGYRN